MGRFRDYAFWSDDAPSASFSQDTKEPRWDSDDAYVATPKTSNQEDSATMPKCYKGRETRNVAKSNLKMKRFFFNFIFENRASRENRLPL